jgi:glycosyltransferase involved in cell wall biosynthesis
MKICHFISSVGLGRGEFYIDLVNELSKNENVYLLIPKNAKYLHRISNKITIIEYKSKDSRYNPFLYLELFKIFKNNLFDVVHTHFAKSSEIFYTINKFLKTIHVATKHNPRKGNIFNKIKYVTAVSKDVAKSIKTDSQIIYNGLNPIKLINSKKNDIFTITAIGRLDKIKGFDILIKESKKITHDFRLNIIGDGDERENLDKIIKDLNLEKQVKLLGFQKNIPEIINNADLVVMSSLSEGFSLVMLEALFYAKIFISTKVSGCKDLLSEDLLIDEFFIAKKINNIIENHEKYEKIFQLIKQENQSKFILKHISNQYLEYYKVIIEKENV